MERRSIRRARVPSAIRGAVAAAAVALACASALERPACAEPPPRPARTLAEDLQGPARAAFDQARTLFEHGDFVTAHAKFREAFELARDVRLVWNMAACSSKQRRYARAIDEAERYLADGQGLLSAEQQERARAFVTEMRAFVAEASFVVSPEGASLAIDGEPVTALTGTQGRFTRLLEVGVHEVAAERADHEPHRERLTVEGPAAIARTITLVPVARLARLVVEAPGDARVLVDDRPATRGRFEGPLPPGPHRVRVEADDREPYVVVFDLAPGASKSVSVTLTPVARTPWWPWAVGGAAVACGAALGGYLLLKPDPVQEPQLPGTLGTVYLR
jgi:hypothetical protein